MSVFFPNKKNKERKDRVPQDPRTLEGSQKGSLKGF